MQSVSKHELVKQISVTGQLIERKSAHLQEINVDEEKLVACLTKEEQEQVKSLLLKLNSYWKETHKKVHQ